MSIYFPVKFAPLNFSFSALRYFIFFGKELKHYLENKSTREFIGALSNEVGIPTSDLIQIVRGGHPKLQGTWGLNG